MTVTATSAADNTRSASATIWLSPTGLVALYSFSEGSGAVVHDTSGAGNDGVLAGATWTNSGKSGSALVFSGTSWVTVPNSASLNPAKGITLEAWVNPSSLDSADSWVTVVAKERTQDLSYGLFATSRASSFSPPVPAGLVFASGYARLVFGPSVIPINVWTHLATTYDGANLRLFVNGVLVATTLISGTLDSGDQPLRIGGNSPWGEYFTGVIDEVRVYNRALSQNEIQSDLQGLGNVAVTLAPAGVTVHAFQSQQFTATVTGSANTGVNWGVALGSGRRRAPPPEPSALRASTRRLRPSQAPMRWWSRRRVKRTPRNRPLPPYL